MTALSEATVFGWHWPGEEWAKSFRFVHGETPLSTFHSVGPMLGLYLSVVLGGRWLMNRFRRGRPFHLKPLLVVHNGLLSAASLSLLTLIVALLIPKFLKGGFIFLLCSPEMEEDHRLTALYYANYIVKYLEFIDTLFLVLHHSKLEFLHVYHHTATMFLCWTQLREYTSIQWLPITLNLCVHVIMYYYYMMAALGIKSWWKRYLTAFQILQFVLDIFFCSFATYANESLRRFPQYSIGFDCHGTEWAAFIGVGILGSYLLLFISFYIKTYITSRLHLGGSHSTAAEKKEPVPDSRRRPKKEE